jgi:ABC-2 type transport system permease protein
MSFTAFSALVRRDLRLFFMDRRAVIMSFVAPILIASFFGYVFGGASADQPASRIAVAAIDQDRSAISKHVLAALGADKALEVKSADLEAARAAVRGGKTTVAVVIPAGFGDGAAKSLFRGEDKLRGGDKPEMQLLYDPSHNAELAMVRGILTQHVMEAVSSEAFSGGTGGTGGAGPGLSMSFSMPYTVREEAVTARQGVKYNSMAHSFAGMSVQFILFMGIDAGVMVLLLRRSGVWSRMRAAPISRFTIIGSRAASSAIVAMMILCVVFGFARVVFGVRIEGSFAGFAGVCIAFAIMTAAFGLLVAVLGKTPEAARGIAILATLLLVMLGGSWVPTFLFPQWLQSASFAVPTRWAVDGLDATIWRGASFTAALGPIAAMLGFAVLFGAIALWRFRWDGPA